MITKAAKVSARKKGELFSLLACASRILIVQVLRKKKKLTVQALAQELGMTHSAVSHQLGMLVAYKIVAYQKEGRQVSYSIAQTPQAKELARVCTFSFTSF